MGVGADVDMPRGREVMRVGAVVEASADSGAEADVV